MLLGMHLETPQRGLCDCGARRYGARASARRMHRRSPAGLTIRRPPCRGFQAQNLLKLRNATAKVPCDYHLAPEEASLWVALSHPRLKQCRCRRQPDEGLGWILDSEIIPGPGRVNDPPPPHDHPEDEQTQDTYGKKVCLVLPPLVKMPGRWEQCCEHRCDIPILQIYFAIINNDDMATGWGFWHRLFSSRSIGR